MLTLEESADRIQVATPNLRLAFEQIGDRWEHSISLKAPAFEWRNVLKSIEGLPADSFPPSPAFQDLRLEKIDETTYEFQLLGQSGKNIYSAAVRFEGHNAAIDFDVCLRTRDHLSDAACSTYSFTDEAGCLLLPNNAGVCINSPELPLQIETVEIPGYLLARFECESNNAVIHGVRSKSAGANHPPQSIRWRYRISQKSDASKRIS